MLFDNEKSMFVNPGPVRTFLPSTGKRSTEHKSHERK